MGEIVPIQSEFLWVQFVIWEPYSTTVIYEICILYILLIEIVAKV